MSVEISRAFTEQYSKNVFLESEQKESRLEGRVDVRSGVVGASLNVERIGITTAQLRITRHGDTPITDIPHSRRRLHVRDYEHAALIDDQDQIKMLINPQSPYIIKGVQAMNRAKDKVIIDAGLGSASIQEGGTVALPTTQKIAHGSVGLTIAKLRLAKRMFDENEVDEDEERYAAISAQQLDNLFSTTEVTSSDFNTVKALAHGNINSYLGFEFVRTQQLPLVGTARHCMFWAKSGIQLGIGANIKSRVGERMDKSYATQVYGSMSLGAVRMEEARVIEVACTEV